MKLREIAHARTGDKGNIVTISLIAWRPEDYPRLVERVTAEAVSERYAPLIIAHATRYELPRLHALNFVLERAKGRTVTNSLALDTHGKCLGDLLLDMEIY
jgi:hypothetical protein